LGRLGIGHKSCSLCKLTDTVHFCEKKVERILQMIRVGVPRECHDIKYNDT
jgi:hypothetical protein